MRNPTRTMWRIILLGGGMACLPLGCPPGSTPEPSAGVTSVNPAQASPGSMVTVTADKGVFGSDTAVTIGNQSVIVQSVASDVQAVVIVPNLLPGAVEVRIVENGKTPGASGGLAVLPAPVQRLVLSFSNNKVQLVSARPGPGGFGENAREGGQRVSYDVLDSQGRTIFTGAVVHPTLGRAEVFEPLGGGQFTVRQVAVSPSAVFALKIPNLSGVTKVQFYDAAADLDLGTAAGRAGRVFLNEITLGG